jgi:ethanolamine utilization protein EutN
MQIGRVVGHGVSTVKHPSLAGWRLLLVQMLGPDGQEDGEPLLVIDRLGAGPGARVVATNDGAAAREIVGVTNTPVRWVVIGLVDE